MGFEILKKISENACKTFRSISKTFPFAQFLGPQIYNKINSPEVVGVFCYFWDVFSWIQKFCFQ